MKAINITPDVMEVLSRYKEDIMANKMKNYKTMNIPLTKEESAELYKNKKKSNQFCQSTKRGGCRIIKKHILEWDV